VRALVTGGTGFVGSHLVEALLEAGDTVTVLARSPGKAAGLGERGVRIIEGDLGSPALLRRAAEGQDAIYHSAGLVAALDEETFLAINRDGTARLLAAAAPVCRARFVFLSSLAAAGPSPRGSRRRGEEPPEPVSGYGRSKLAGEAVVRAGTLPWVIARPPGVYGPRDPEFFRLFRAARFGFLPVFDGEQQLSLVYARDLARALVLLGRTPEAVGGTFYPCHPEIVTSAELARGIGRAVGRTVRVVPLPRWMAKSALVASALAARLTGGTTLLTPDKGNELFAPAWTCDPGPLERATAGRWQAEYDLEQGARETAAWYRQAGWLS
jgi:nucleoside-diphosphate-sugar epimerase